MGKKQTKNAPIAYWQDQEPTDEEREKFKIAVVDYALKHKLRAKDLNASQRMITKYIPTLAEISPKWASVNESNFRIKRYAAHRSFYDTVRYLTRNHDRLDALIDKKRDDDHKAQDKTDRASEHIHNEGDQSSTPLDESEHDENFDVEQSQDHLSNSQLNITENPRKIKSLGKRKANHASRQVNSAPQKVEMVDLYDQYERLWVETMKVQSTLRTVKVQLRRWFASAAI